MKGEELEGSAILSKDDPSNILLTVRHEGLMYSGGPIDEHNHIQFCFSVKKIVHAIHSD